MPEALEKWSVPLFGRLLPRHLEIIYEINRRFLDEVRAQIPGDDARVARMSLIDESGERSVRMAHLATVGSHHLNGVARLDSDLLKQTVMHDFAALWPEKFCNVTNGVTPRRFVAVSNPLLTQLITSRIGDGWLRDLDQLRKLEPLAHDAKFQQQWRDVKLAAKRSLAVLIEQRTGIQVESGFALRHPGQAPRRRRAGTPPPRRRCPRARGRCWPGSRRRPSRCRCARRPTPSLPWRRASRDRS